MQWQVECDLDYLTGLRTRTTFDAASQELFIQVLQIKSWEIWFHNLMNTRKKINEWELSETMRNKSKTQQQRIKTKNDEMKYKIYIKTELRKTEKQIVLPKVDEQIWKSNK